MVRRVVPRASGATPVDAWPRLRVATDTDEGFVRELSEQVFAVFGDYGDFLPHYLAHPAVFTTIAEDEGRPLGFVMLALVPHDTTPTADHGKTPRLPEEAPADVAIDAEILAIAVAPAHHGRGLGKRLMQHALDFAHAWRGAGVRSVQLNVADTNVRALAFFAHAGFMVVNAKDGVYPRGQRSIRMARTFP